jgi:23S rRNA (guanosine2251-2'-O)-methyltransferase
MQKNYSRNDRSKRPAIDKEKLIYGRHPVMDAIKNGMSVDKVILSQIVKGEFEKELRKLCKLADIPLQVAPKERLEKITKKNHQGIIGFLSHIKYLQIEDVFPMIYDKGETPLIIVLDGVTDVRNFGAIARSAEASGAHALIVPNKKTAQINAEAIKASAGALSTIPVCRTASLGNAVDYLLMNGVQVIAAGLQGKSYLHELDLTIPTAIVMGAEGEGIRPHIMRKANEVFKIPMKGQTDSFNVSVATGIILYETGKQRFLESL